MKSCVTFLAFIILINFSPAFSKVIYKDIEPDVKLQGDESNMFDPYYLDLDADGQDDFYFKHFYLAMDVYGAEVYTNIGTENEILIDSQNRPIALVENSQVQAVSGEWKNTASGSSSSALGLDESWQGQGDKYLGLRFKINSELHYAWVKLEVAENSAYLVIKEYAYEDQAGESIVAGYSSTAAVDVYPKENLYNFFCGANELTIENRSPKEINFKLYDVLGNEYNSRSINVGYNTINISKLPAGQYFAILRIENRIFSEIIIKD